MPLFNVKLPWKHFCKLLKGTSSVTSSCLESQKWDEVRKRCFAYQLKDVFYRSKLIWIIVVWKSIAFELVALKYLFNGLNKKICDNFHQGYNFSVYLILRKSSTFFSFGSSLYLQVSQPSLIKQNATTKNYIIVKYLLNQQPLQKIVAKISPCSVKVFKF